jgi:transcriptional regulator with XRE-family HTH domain
MAKQVMQTQKPKLDNVVDMSLLGQMVKYKRTSIGMRLEDAASLCSVSKQAYNNIELGVENVRANTLFKVLAGLGVKLFIADFKEVDSEWV